MLTTSHRCLQRVKLWLLELPTAKLIVLALAGTYLAIIPLLICAPFLTPGQTLGGPDLGKGNVFKLIAIGCVAAPLIETTIHQWGCLRVLGKLRCKTGIAICISALLFGLSHSYSAPYVVLGTLVGGILATVFAIEDSRKGHPFIATLAVHALRNGITAAITLFVL